MSLHRKFTAVVYSLVTYTTATLSGNSSIYLCVDNPDVHAAYAHILAQNTHTAVVCSSTNARTNKPFKCVHVTLLSPRLLSE